MVCHLLFPTSCMLCIVPCLCMAFHCLCYMFSRYTNLITLGICTVCGVISIAHSCCVFNPCFLFWRSRVQISVQKLVILNEDFMISLAVKKNVRTAGGYGHLCPSLFPFGIHLKGTAVSSRHIYFLLPPLSTFIQLNV